eukprot:CAMPEP_0172728966 /NCGR_PEP_ID=MMETSP1074-20121228/93305_1 /TAXON_ID=2916 /ORGANISM="Ceratium fusus, Strain PA161109" /LENGTH=61 /DNA_ID=CAMNT_0013556299 /DNA_START=39 /DNA_END=221 /DNA_ORIENTATION=+
MGGVERDPNTEHVVAAVPDGQGLVAEAPAEDGADGEDSAVITDGPATDMRVAPAGSGPVSR